MEVQQSPLYATYIQLLGWRVVQLNRTNVFIKYFPFVGGFAKIHRPQKLPTLKAINDFCIAHKIKKLAIEPDITVSQDEFSRWYKKIPPSITLNTSAFLPTKTLHIPLTVSESSLFASLTEAKRRAVRRATALGVSVEESTDIQKLIQIKNASAGLFGFITTSGLRELWKCFSPKNATILLAYDGSRPHKPIGGVLLLFWNTTAYYWIAGATRQGKKHFAPTLLAWEAIKLSKRKNARIFDFVGAWDERMPTQNTEWKGFTKFKEGFGGKTIYYPVTTN
jgi:lipid II:glycine glycyltransferase (peptidoglycan interpeptide bridge formation enzyme)